MYGGEMANSIFPPYIFLSIDIQFGRLTPMPGLPRSGRMNLGRLFKAFVITKLLREKGVHIFSLRSRRQSKAWVERQRNPRNMA